MGPNYVFLTTVYSCGLRLQEALFLEIPDIDSNRMMIHVHRGKGAKDRYVPLPEETLMLLGKHWKTHRNPRLLFPARGRNCVAERFCDPAVKASVEADLKMIDAYHQIIVKLEWQINKTARQHDHQTYLLLKTIPGVGQILTLTILYEICTIKRFPSVQDFSSYARLIRPEKESNGKWVGKGNKKIGNAHLKWAIKEAALLFIRESDQAKKYVDKMTKKYDKGKALGLLTHKLGRTIFYMLKNKEAFSMQKFFDN